MMRPMSVNRRDLLLGSLAGAAAMATPARAVPLSRYGLDAAQFGVRAGAAGDQSAKLQRAINAAAQTRAPLMLAPGRYHAGNLIAGTTRGAIVGMEWHKPVTGDLAKEGAARFPQLTIANDQAR
jgi:hypothetical protein